MPLTRTEFARIMLEELRPLIEVDAKKTTAERVLDVFVAYADLANGWDPTAEDDWQDVVKTITHLLETAQK